MKSIWNSRGTKIVVDIFMTVFLILSFVRWSGDPTFHFIVGTACTLFFAVHIFIHRKWLKAVTKSYFAGKLKNAIKWKFTTNILLLAVWGVCIVTGFLAIGSLVGGVEWMYIFSRIHGVSARIALALTIIHAIQHRAQIMSYLKMKKRKSAGSERQPTTNEKQIVNSKRATTVIANIVLHILLHIISIHLAVLFMVVHIIAHIFRHRERIFMRLPKVQLGYNDKIISLQLNNEQLENRALQVHALPLAS